VCDETQKHLSYATCEHRMAPSSTDSLVSGQTPQDMRHRQPPPLVKPMHRAKPVGAREQQQMRDHVEMSPWPSSSCISSDSTAATPRFAADLKKQLEEVQGSRVMMHNNMPPCNMPPPSPIIQGALTPNTSLYRASDAASSAHAHGHHATSRPPEGGHVARSAAPGGHGGAEHEAACTEPRSTDADADAEAEAQVDDMHLHGHGQAGASGRRDREASTRQSPRRTSLPPPPLERESRQEVASRCHATDHTLLCLTCVHDMIYTSFV
jgi:hypothetical protein